VRSGSGDHKWPALIDEVSRTPYYAKNHIEGTISSRLEGTLPNRIQTGPKYVSIESDKDSFSRGRAGNFNPSALSAINIQDSPSKVKSVPSELPSPQKKVNTLTIWFESKGCKRPLRARTPQVLELTADETIDGPIRPYFFAYALAGDDSISSRNSLSPPAFFGGTSQAGFKMVRYSTQMRE